MNLYTTVPVENPTDAGNLFRELERIGYDGAFTYETKHDPFLPLAIAAEHTHTMRLGTAIAIAFARNPMTLANTAYDLQRAAEGRFILGLGSQIRPHIVNRYSAMWAKPARRMRELVRAIHAIWDAWDTGRKLDFEGEFYRHTLMTPAFDPGPNPYGRPRIYLAGVQPRMIEVAGEVADGFFAHPFATRKSLTDHILPALDAGLAKSGRTRERFEIVSVALLATGQSEEELSANKEVVRKQLAFYASTPAYKPTLDCHGWGALQPELNRLSKLGRWEEMAALVDDEMLESIAVVAPRDGAAEALRRRFEGLSVGVSIENTRAPDPRNFADIVAAVKADA